MLLRAGGLYGLQCVFSLPPGSRCTPEVFSSSFPCSLNLLLLLWAPGARQILIECDSAVV